jgi:DNA helicase HerA-like ATPase
MAKQKKHIRKSKKGKPFVAGKKKIVPKLEKPKPKYPLNILKNHPIDLTDIIGAFKIIGGTTGQGKSNTLAVFIEEYLDKNLPIILLDVEGEHDDFVKQYDSVYMFDKSSYKKHKDNLQSYLSRVIKNRISLIVDLSTFSNEARDEFVTHFLKDLWAAEEILRRPLALIVEEAHVLVPQQNSTPMKPILVDFAKRGRKRKVEVTFVTQRMQDLDKKVITQAETGFLHKVMYPADLAVYQKMIPSKTLMEQVPHLAKGEVIYINQGKAHRDMVRLRKTEHKSHTMSAEELKEPKNGIFQKLMLWK